MRLSLKLKTVHYLCEEVFYQLYITFVRRFSTSCTLPLWGGFLPVVHYLCEEVFYQLHITFVRRFSTRAMMEFLNAVPAVVGRFVISVTLFFPSGHIPRIISFLLFKTGKKLKYRLCRH